MCSAGGDAALASIWEILGGKRNEAAVIWDEELTQVDQLIALTEAGIAKTEARRLAGVPWEDIPHVVKLRINNAMRIRAHQCARFHAAASGGNHGAN